MSTSEAIWENEDSSSQVFRRQEKSDNPDNEDLERYESVEGNELLEDEEYVEEMDPQQQEEEDQIFTVPINMVTKGELAQAARKWKETAKVKRVRFETEMSPNIQEHTAPHRFSMDQEEPEEISDGVEILEESTPTASTSMETGDRSAIPRPKKFKNLDKMARILSTLTSVSGDQIVMREQYKKMFMEEQRLLSITTDVATKKEWDTARGIHERRKKLKGLSFPGMFENKHFNFPVIMIDDLTGQSRNIPVITINDSEGKGRRKLAPIVPRPEEIDDLDVIVHSDSEDDGGAQNVLFDDEEIMILDGQVIIEKGIEDIPAEIPEQQGYQEPNLNNWQQYKQNRGQKYRKRRFGEEDEHPVIPKQQKRVQFLETDSETFEQRRHEKEKCPPKTIEAQLFIPKRLQLEEGLRRQKAQKRRLQEDQLLSIPYDEATPEEIYQAGLIQMERQKMNRGNAFQDVYVVSRGACFQVSSTSMAGNQ